jgi:hypothetical protein
VQIVRNSARRPLLGLAWLVGSCATTLGRGHVVSDCAGGFVCTLVAGLNTQPYERPAKPTGLGGPYPHPFGSAGLFIGLGFGPDQRATQNDLRSAWLLGVFLRVVEPKGALPFRVQNP